MPRLPTLLTKSRRWELSRCLAAAFLFLQAFSVWAHELDLSLGAERWLYREYDFTDTELDREQGWLAQAQLRTELAVTEQHRVYALYRYQWGDIAYLGQTQSGAPLHTRSFADTRQAVLTWRYYWSPVFIGLGANQQSWDRRIQSTANTDKLYEYYRWQGYVLELGVLGRFGQTELRALANYSQNWGYMEADFSALKIGGLVKNYGKPRMHFAYGEEAQLQLQLKHPLSQGWYTLLESYLGWRRFPESETVFVRNLSFYEPKSTQLYLGINLGLGVRF